MRFGRLLLPDGTSSARAVATAPGSAGRAPSGGFRSMVVGRWIAPDIRAVGGLGLGLARRPSPWPWPARGCSYMHGLRAASSRRKVGGVRRADGRPVPRRITGRPAGRSRAGGRTALASVEPEPPAAAFVRSTRTTSTPRPPRRGGASSRPRSSSLGAPRRPADAPSRPGRRDPRGRVAEPPPPSRRRRPTIGRRRQAARRVDAMTTYQVEINRQERVGEVLLPAEDVRPEHPARPEGGPAGVAGRPAQGARGDLLGERARRPDPRPHGRLARSRCPTSACRPTARWS